MGSRAGRPNKNKQFLMARLKDMYGEDFDPVMQMAANAWRYQTEVVNLSGAEDQKFGEIVNRANVLWGDVAEYVTPKLKAVEVELGTQEGDVLTDFIARLSARVIEPND